MVKMSSYISGNTGFVRRRRRKYTRRILLVIAIIALLFSIYGFVKPLPAGISREGEIYQADQVELLFDTTYQNFDGEIMHDQVIFDHVLEMIGEAQDFIVLDMFLFNDDYDRSDEYPNLSVSLAEALIDKKNADPAIEIAVITDPINTFYGVYEPDHLQRLKQNGIRLVYTDLTKLRDSNPAFSGFWRMALRWTGTAGSGWLPNPFSPDSPDVTLRSYFSLLNFKANHRKVLIADDKALVTSANPHDASAYHSNVAFVVEGNVARDLLESEKAVARMSGADEEWLDRFELPVEPGDAADAAYSIQMLTEGKIREHLLQAIAAAQDGDTIRIGVFYMSDRKLIHELLAAHDRGADIRLILDANKDAFGREKNGVPNRPVAHELRNKSDGDIQVRWYNTNGEQFHTKMAIVEYADRTVIIGGSANFTKRNLADLNLETDLKLSGASDLETMREAVAYFDALWDNDGGLFTLDYEAYADESLTSRLLYRFQEWSGISSF